LAGYTSAPPRYREDAKGAVMLAGDPQVYSQKGDEFSIAKSPNSNDPKVTFKNGKVFKVVQFEEAEGARTHAHYTFDNGNLTKFNAHSKGYSLDIIPAADDSKKAGHYEGVFKYTVGSGDDAKKEELKLDAVKPNEHGYVSFEVSEKDTKAIKKAIEKAADITSKKAEASESKTKGVDLSILKPYLLDGENGTLKTPAFMTKAEHFTKGLGLPSNMSLDAIKAQGAPLKGETAMQLGVIGGVLGLAAGGLGWMFTKSRTDKKNQATPVANVPTFQSPSPLTQPSGASRPMMSTQFPQRAAYPAQYRPPAYAPRPQQQQPFAQQAPQQVSVKQLPQEPSAPQKSEASGDDSSNYVMASVPLNVTLKNSSVHTDYEATVPMTIGINGKKTKVVTTIPLSLDANVAPVNEKVTANIPISVNVGS